MNTHRLAKEVKTLRETNIQKQNAFYSLDSICKVKKFATTPFYYYYTEVWKEWPQKK